MTCVSPSREAVLRAMRQLTSEGRLPSIRSICDVTGLSSTSTVMAHVRNLEEEGRVVKVRTAGARRRASTYVVVGQSCPTCARPLGEN